MEHTHRKQEGWESMAGNFLVAETDLGDPNFIQTVVLVIDHNADGAFGLVVNRRSDFTLGDAAISYKTSPLGGIPLYVGGPVDQEYLFCLHGGLPPEGTGTHSRVIFKGLVFEPQFQVVEQYILSQVGMFTSDIRLFAGYSGWGPGQLEEELAEKTWVILPGAVDLVFHPNPQEGWRDALKKKGGVYWAAATTGIKPNMN